MHYILQIQNLMEVFRDSIAHSDWLSVKTAERAQAKLNKLRHDKVAFPPILRDDAALNAAHASLNLSGGWNLLEYGSRIVIVAAVYCIVRSALTNLLLSGSFSFLENTINLARTTTDTSLAVLWTGSKPDPTAWPCSAATMNAFYNAPTNEMVLPIAMLSPPFYDNKYPRSLVYGGIGAVIGHELVHAFDDQGTVFLDIYILMMASHPLYGFYGIVMYSTGKVCIAYGTEYNMVCEYFGVQLHECCQRVEHY